MDRFLKWLDNYWYHYKWVTIICVFLAAVLVIGVVQMAGAEENDVGIVYFGPSVLSADQTYEMELAFEQVMSKDYDGDGKRNALLISMTYMTDEQYEEKMKQAEEDEVYFAYDKSARNETIRQLNTLISTGETVICLIDESMYQTLNEQGCFESLQEVLGYTPSYAADDYSVRLGDTEFGEYYTAFDCVDPETRLCICKISQNTYFMNEKAIQQSYDRNKKMFCDIFALDSTEDVR